MFSGSDGTGDDRGGGEIDHGLPIADHINP
jgi:hypothetical protein